MFLHGQLGVAWNVEGRNDDRSAPPSTSRPTPNPRMTVFLPAGSARPRSTLSGRRPGRTRRHGFAARPRGIPRCSHIGRPDSCRRLSDKSRMSGNVHVRFCERVGVRFPCSTRLSLGEQMAPAPTLQDSPTEISEQAPFSRRPLGEVSLAEQCNRQDGRGARSGRYRRLRRYRPPDLGQPLESFPFLRTRFPDA